MLEGMYAAAAGMQAAQTQLDTVANNIANDDTPGYQTQELAFHDLLYTTDDDAPSSALVGAGSAAQTLGYDQSQGALEQTGNPLDLAIDGPGFFEVRQQDGQLGLTRNGSFQLNAAGQITTATGMELVPPITVPKGTSEGQIAIAANGQVTANGQNIGRINVVSVPAPDKLAPQGDSVYATTAGSGPIVAAGGQVQQGFLEGSNVDMNVQVADMESAQQSYEMASRAIAFESQMGQIAAELK